MVQATEHGRRFELHDRRRFTTSRDRRVALQGQVWPRDIRARSACAISGGRPIVQGAVPQTEHQRRPRRPPLGARTAAEIDRTLPSWDGVLDRRAFYDAACRAREHAVLGTVGARARRLAEREAIWRVLEDYGLVRRTRGGVPLPSREAEGIS